MRESSSSYCSEQYHSFTEIKADMKRRETDAAKKNTLEYKTRYAVNKKDKELQLQKNVKMFENDFEKMVSKCGKYNPQINGKFRFDGHPRLPRQPLCLPSQTISRTDGQSQQGCLSKSSYFFETHIPQECNRNYFESWNSSTVSPSMSNVRSNGNGILPTPNIACSQKAPAEKNFELKDAIMPPIHNICDFDASTLSCYSWEEIEKKNVNEIIEQKRAQRFFRLDVTQHQIYKSLINNGRLELPRDIIKGLSCISPAYVNYFFLQECTTQIESSVQLIGIAQLCEPVPVFDEYGSSEVYVVYYCLSRSGIDTRMFDVNSQVNDRHLLQRYSQVLNDKAAQPFIPEIYPYSGVVPDFLRTSGFSLSARNSKDHGQVNKDDMKDVNSEVAYDKFDVYDDIDATTVATLPPLKRLQNSDKTLNIEPWETLEYRNLEEISECIQSRYYIYDVTLEILRLSLRQNGELKVENFMCDILANVRSRPTYLVLREARGERAATKPVIGVAFAASNSEVIGQLRIVFLCLSRPRYVGSPWCDEELYTSGQELVHKEDIRILLDEYKMSLRHHKVEAVFHDVYPWSGNPPVVRMKSNEQVLKLKQMDNEDHHCATRSDSNHNKLSSEKISPTTPSKQFKKKTHSPQQTAPLTPKKKQPNPGIPNKSSFSTPKKHQNLKNSSLLTQGTPKNASPPRNKSPPRNTRRPSRLLPNLKGLYVGCTKEFCSDSWQMLEKNNIEQLTHICGDIEFYLCDTNIYNIRQSFKTSLLEISESNVQNLASSGRGRKYFVLRTHVHDQNTLSIIGIANVLVSDCLIKVPNKSGYFYAKVLYYCLSLPNLRGNPLLRPTHCDGMEIYAHIVNQLCQQYMMCLKEGKARPIFNDIFPWCSSPPPQKGSSSKSSTKSPLTSPYANVKENNNVFFPASSECSKKTAAVVDDTIADVNLLSLLDSGISPTINFAQIEREISEVSIQASPASAQLYPALFYPREQTHSKKLAEGRYKKIASEFTCDFEKNNINNSIRSPLKSKGVNKSDFSAQRGRARGRGRGTLLLQQVRLLP